MDMNGSTPLPSFSGRNAPSTSSSYGGQMAAEVHPEINDTHFTAAPICLVLTDEVQKTFAKGDPLIVGTSMGDIQIFFQKVISEAQLGVEQNIQRNYAKDINRWAQGGSTGKTVDPGDYPWTTERYPVPHKPRKQRRERNPDEEENDNERCEIPLDAIRLYLKDQKYFPGWGANSKRNLRKRCDDFKLDGTKLLYRTRRGIYVECVEDRVERMRLIWQQHSIDHRRRDRLFSCLKDKYYWKGMLYDINKALGSCEYCAKVRLEKQEHERNVGHVNLDQEVSLDSVMPLTALPQFSKAKMAKLFPNMDLEALEANSIARRRKDTPNTVNYSV